LDSRTSPTHNSNAIIHSSVCWMHKQIEKLSPNFHFHFALPFPPTSLLSFPFAFSQQESPKSHRRQGYLLFPISISHTHTHMGGRKGGESPPTALRKQLIFEQFYGKSFLQPSRKCVWTGETAKKEMTEKSKVHKI